MPTRDINYVKLKELRKQIKAGVEELERGEFTEVLDADLDRYLESLTAKARKPAN